MHLAPTAFGLGRKLFTHALGAILGGFGAEKDTDRRFSTRGYTVPYAQHNTLRLSTCARWAGVTHKWEKVCQSTMYV